MWKSDGTEEGTFQFKRLHNNSSDSVVIAEVYSDSARDLIYFRAIIINDDGSRTNNLYISDGTAEGTILVKDLSEGTGDTYFESLTIFNDELYFITTSPDSNKKEIFKTDGTEEGTVQLTDIHENNGGVMGPLVEVNGKLYFSAGDRDEYGRELWVTDGTETVSYTHLTLPTKA